MTGGDVVCSGWLRKSPPEKKLRRYVSLSLIIFISCFGSLPQSGCIVAASGGSVVDTPPHPGLGGPPAMLTNVPPPYQPVSVRHLDSESSLDEPQDYLWLVNCESKKPEPNRWVAHAECSKSNSSETDLNDNVPAHRTPTSTSSSSKHANGFFSSVPPPHPASASSIYDSPPSRGADLSSSLYHLPRSYSQDTVLLPKSASASSPPVPVDGDAQELYVFSAPSRKPSMETQMRNLSVSYDIPPTPGSNCTYQVPRGPASGGSEGGDGMPPPRPPKPSLSSLTPGHPPPPAERSPTDTYCVPRSMSETDGNYCVPTSAGNKALRSNTIGTMDSSRLRKDLGSQDCYDIPRTFPSDKSCSFDFNESFNSYLKNKGMMPVGSQSMEEVDQNYVPMSANSPSHHRSGSLSGCEPIMEPNYVPMTPGPGTLEFSLGKQVPPPAHMGFRSSPNTPPRRPMLISDCQPPPVDRNLKPDRKAKPAPLEIKPLPEWEESSAPVRSPVTRSFARDPSRFPMPPRPPSVHSTASSTDSEDCDENYVAMVSKADELLGAPMTADGGSSPMVKPKGDKQVEYLDLDLDPGKSTPPRKKKSNGIGLAVSDERVDYVVVDQQRTQALKSTREAWNDGRQSTETDTSTKGPK
uniref:GRB2-associated binding protein 1 n=1 Tax=Hucho hucho TaxID=62062 RepID=A0A4W5RX23_9TELE